MNRLFVVGVLTLISAAPAAAQGSWDSLTIHTGALVATVGSTLRFDPSIGQQGTSIDLEDELGFQTTSASFFAEGTWRLSRRNQLQFSYYDIRRSVSNEILDRDIMFGPITFPAHLSVDAHFNTAFFTANYGFNIVANPTAEIGVMIGLTALRIDTGMNVVAQIGSNNPTSNQLTENVTFTAPVPLPGVYANIRPNDRVTIDGFARFLKITIGDFGGGMTEARAGADVKLWQWLGVGGAYYYNRIAADYTGTVFKGRIVYAFNGPQVYALLTF